MTGKTLTFSTLKKVSNKVKSEDLAEYMDDLIMMGPLATVCKVWPELVNRLLDVGLEVNIPKCKVYHENLATLGTNTLPIDEAKDGIVMVGVPIGSEQFIYNYWKGEFDSIQDEITAVCEYEDTQVALLFL
eukprot:gene26080-32610_t